MAVLHMGVRGAAIATVTAQGIAFAAALVYMLRNRAHYGLAAKYLRPAWEKVKSILRLGLPLALQFTIANCIVVRVVLAIAFNALWGIWGVYIAFAVAPAISVPIGYFFYRSGRWRQGLVGGRAPLSS